MMDKARFWAEAEVEGCDTLLLLIYSKGKELGYHTFIEVEDLKRFVKKCRIRKYYVLRIEGIFEMDALKNAVCDLITD